MSEKTGQDQNIEVGRLSSPFYSIKAIRKDKQLWHLSMQAFVFLRDITTSWFVSGNFRWA